MTAEARRRLLSGTPGNDRMSVMSYGTKRISQEQVRLGWCRPAQLWILGWLGGN